MLLLNLILKRSLIAVFLIQFNDNSEVAWFLFGHLFVKISDFHGWETRLGLYTLMYTVSTVITVGMLKRGYFQMPSE